MQLAKKNKSIHFIIPAEIGVSPGQRFRFEHYLTILKQNGYKIKISPFYDITDWGHLYKHNHQLKKLLIVTKGMLRRIRDTFLSVGYDYIYIYR